MKKLRRRIILILCLCLAYEGSFRIIMARFGESTFIRPSVTEKDAVDMLFVIIYAPRMFINLGPVKMRDPETFLKNGTYHNYWLKTKYWMTERRYADGRIRSRVYVHLESGQRIMTAVCTWHPNGEKWFDFDIQNQIFILYEDGTPTTLGLATNHDRIVGLMNEAMR